MEEELEGHDRSPCDRGPREEGKKEQKKHPKNDAKEFLKLDGNYKLTDTRHSAISNH